MLSLVVITGLSGAGKTTAANTLEDQGYYTIDNMPLILIEKFVNVFFDLGISNTKIALVIDSRAGDIKQAYTTIKFLKDKFDAKVIFLSSSQESLVQRYKTSRRKHPMGNDIIQAINEEIIQMKDIQELSDISMDTSSMNVHELSAELSKFFEEVGTKSLKITINSFGFKHGVPVDSDLVFDVRFIRNPHFVDSMRNRTGLDKDVSDYVFEDPSTSVFIEKLCDMLMFLIPKYQKEGKKYLVISIGCTGGHHRSVAIAEYLTKYLKEHEQPVLVKHRDILR